MEKIYEIGGLKFSSETEYRKALEELQFIAELQSKYDFSEPDKAKSVLKRIYNGRIKFSTQVGEKFENYLINRASCKNENAEDKTNFYEFVGTDKNADAKVWSMTLENEKEEESAPEKADEEEKEEETTSSKRKHILSKGAMLGLVAVIAILVLLIPISQGLLKQSASQQKKVEEDNSQIIDKETSSVGNELQQSGSETEAIIPFANETYINRACTVDEAIAYLMVLVPSAGRTKCVETITDCGKRYYKLENNTSERTYYVPVEGGEILFSDGDYNFEPLCRHEEIIK